MHYIVKEGKMFSGIVFIGTICVTCGFLLACFIMRPIWIKKGRHIEREEQEEQKIREEHKAYQERETKAASERFN